MDTEGQKTSLALIVLALTSRRLTDWTMWSMISTVFKKLHQRNRRWNGKRHLCRI